MTAKRLISTLCLAVAATVSSLYAQAVGDLILDNHYEITSINPNEVKLRKGYDGIGVYDALTYNNQTYHVTAVGPHAFSNVNHLSSLKFGYLKSLDEHAFENIKCANVNMEGCTLTEIPQDAFYSSEVNVVRIPNTVTTIGILSFNLCKNLTQLIGGSITTIGNNAFNKCPRLTTIDLNHVQTIGENAFFQCTSLSEVHFPQSLTAIGNAAFYDCNLHTLSMYNTTSTFGVNVRIVASDAVVTMHIADWGNKNVLTNRAETAMAIHYQYNDVPVTGNYTVPSTVTTMGEGALYHCTDLTGITLPASLTSMDSCALAKCINLAAITCNATTAPAVANENAFSEISKVIPVTIPDNAGAYYSYRHTKGWKDFTNYQVSLPTIKAVAIQELNDAVGGHTESSILDVLEEYTNQISAATSKVEVETICAEAIPVLSLAAGKLDCIAAVKAAAVGVVAENLQAMIDSYVARINAAGTISAAEAVRDEAIAVFQLMKDKQPMLEVLESKKQGVQSEAILSRIQDYIDTISNPAISLDEARTVYEQALPIVDTLLEGYREGLKDAFPQPTESGIRMKVTKKDGKVYEFDTKTIESVEYYEFTE